MFFAEGRFPDGILKFGKTHFSLERVFIFVYCTIVYERDKTLLTPA